MSGILKEIEGLKSKFVVLFNLVLNDHENFALKSSLGNGHDFIHALTVAGYGFLIAPDRVTGEKSWVAGLCHNTDRIFSNFSEEELRKHVLKYLNKTKFSEIEKEEIIEAVLNHDKANDENGSLVKMVLQDADRLANLGLAFFIRVGQHRSGKLVFDPCFVEKMDLSDNYSDPRTALHDVQSSLEWDPEGEEKNPKFCLRLPKAIEIGRPFFDYTRKGINLLSKQVKDLGLDGKIVLSAVSIKK